MTTFRRRLDKVEAQFDPKQTFIAWMTKLHGRFPSNSEYRAWRAARPDAPVPVNDLLAQMEAAVRNQKKGAPQQEIRKAIWKAADDVGFFLMLVVNVHEYVKAQLQVIELQWEVLLQLLRIASGRESGLKEVQELVGDFARTPYPLYASDAASVLTTIRNRVLTFAHLEAGRKGLLFGAHTISSTDLDQRFNKQENPVFDWVWESYRSEGKTVLPEVVYEARERQALFQDRSHANLIFSLDRDKVRNLFLDSEAYGDFLSGRDFSYGLANVRDQEFDQAIESVVRSLRELVASGEVQAAKQIFIPSSPFPFLRQVPLIDHQWVDLHAIELAEFGCRLLQEGFEICESSDPHPLALCWPWPEEYEKKKELDALRNKVAESLSRFPGRVISIEGRPLLNLADYLAWPDAQAARELKVEEGFSAASFDVWFERQATEDVKLAGINVWPFGSSLTESSFVTYSSSDEASDEQYHREQVIASIERRGEPDPGWLNLDLDRLWEISHSLAFAVLTINAVVKYIEEKFFDSQPVLIKQEADKIALFKQMLPGCASWSERFLVSGSWQTELSKGKRRRARQRSFHIDLDRIEKSIDPEREAKCLIKQAKIEVAGSKNGPLK